VVAGGFGFAVVTGAAVTGAAVVAGAAVVVVVVVVVVDVEVVDVVVVATRGAPMPSSASPSRQAAVETTSAMTANPVRTRMAPVIDQIRRTV
jgi:hypothetical protein